MIKYNLYFIPLLILIAVLIHTLYIVSTTEIMLGYKHYMGIVFTGVCIVFSFIKKTMGVYLTGIALFFGTFNRIAFTAAIESYSIGFKMNTWGITSIKIQPFSFAVLIVFLWINGKKILNDFKAIRNNDMKVNEDA